ncbi:MAG: hypothetical protein LBL59_11915 [Xanthomonadaceae bacterium]|nr:hypothetical protein [Xanthomonadaceae bacterium]
MVSFTPSRLQQLLDLLRAGNVDGAIENGLMDYVATPEDSRLDAPVLEAQRRLQAAWQARDRYHAFRERLETRGKQRRLPPGAVTIGERQPRMGGGFCATTALPPDIAEILARAKAKASRSGSK